MKFKVGDKVKVKSLPQIVLLSDSPVRNGFIWCTCEDTDGLGRVIKAGDYFTPEMHDFCDKEFVIEKAIEDGHYKLSDGECSWYFIASWLELLSQHYVETFDEE